MIREYHTTRRTTVETRNAEPRWSLASARASATAEASPRGRGRPPKTRVFPHGAGSFNIIPPVTAGQDYVLIDGMIPKELASAMRNLFEAYRSVLPR